MTGPATNA